MTSRVGHFFGDYLPLTQTFIYQYLTNHNTYEPFVCASAGENLDRFPFEPRYVFTEKSKFDPRFWVHGTLAKLDIRGMGKSYYRTTIERTKPDVLHAHFGPIGVKLATNRRPDRPLVTSFYGYDASRIAKEDRDMRANYRELFRTGDLFLVEGPAMQQKLIALGCPEEKIAIQRIGIDIDRIEPQYPSDTATVRVLMVGRFVEKKGISDGIRAFAEAFGGVDWAELRIVGGSGTEPESKFRRLAAEAGISEQVTFTGLLPYDEYLTEVHSCDLLLAPSKLAESGDSEGGAPTVLLEAQASGKPIVATTHADIPYVVEDGIAGRLVPPGNVGALADALTWFRDTPSAFTKMGRNGRDNVKQHHDITDLAQQLENRYNRLQ